MTRAEIVQKIESLPPELQREVADFIDFIEQRHRRHVSGQINLDWVGALQDMREQYSSVELQHAIAEMRAGSR